MQDALGRKNTHKSYYTLSFLARLHSHKTALSLTLKMGHAPVNSQFPPMLVPRLPLATTSRTTLTDGRSILEYFLLLLFTPKGVWCYELLQCSSFQMNELLGSYRYLERRSNSFATSSRFVKPLMLHKLLLLPSIWLFISGKQQRIIISWLPSFIPLVHTM